MTAMFINIIPEFRHDQAVQRLMVASTSSNLSAVVDMLMLGISLEDISVPPTAAEYARRFAQHDLSLEACCGLLPNRTSALGETLGCHPHRVPDLPRGGAARAAGGRDRRTPARGPGVGYCHPGMPVGRRPDTR